MKVSRVPIAIFLILLVLSIPIVYGTDFNLTFVANGGSGSMAQQTISNGSTVILNINNYTRTGYNFSGWANNNSADVSYLNGANYTMGNSNAALYAKWQMISAPVNNTERYITITFMPNGGNGSMSPQGIYNGTTANLNLNTYTRDGYNFSGWANISSGAVSYLDGASYTMGNSNVSLYALWAANSSDGPVLNGSNNNGTNNDSTNNNTNPNPYNNSNPTNNTDLANPVISSMKLTGVPSGLEGEYAFTSIDGAIKVSFSASDDSGVFTGVATASMGKVTGSANSTGSFGTGDATCDGSSCVALISGIPSAGEVTVNLVVTDGAGYSTTKSAKINSVPILNGSFWSGTAELSPANWDREVSNMLNQKAYAQITLKSKTGMKLNSVTFDSCVSANSSTTTGKNRGIDYISATTYIGGSTDMTQQNIVFESKTTDFYFDSIKLDCRFTVSSYSAAGIVPSDSFIVPVEIGFYNNPAGLVDQELSDKINSAVSDTEGLWKTLDSIYKFVKILELICRIFNLIQEIINLISLLNNILGIFGMGLKTNPVTASGGEVLDGVQPAICEAEASVNKIWDHEYMTRVSQFCQWVSCERSLWQLLKDWKVEAEWTKTVNGWDQNFKAWNKGPTNGTAFAWSNSISAAGFSFFDEDNILYMFFQMCIPGILKKAHEYRAIQCTYVLCLVEQAESGMIDESICSQVKASQECMYILKIFNFVPFSGFFEMIYDWFKTFWSNDIAGKISMAVSLVCHKTCSTSQNAGTLKFLCNGWIYIEKLMASAATLETMFDGQYFKTTPDNDKACDDMNDALDKFNENQQAIKDQITSGGRATNSTNSTTI